MTGIMGFNSGQQRIIIYNIIIIAQTITRQAWFALGAIMKSTERIFLRSDN